MLLSTGFVDRLGQAGGYARSITNGVMKLYTGVPPATADAAATGTLLATLTSSGSAWTAETQAEWGFTVAYASAGTVATVKVGGIEILGTAVTYATGVNETAAAVAAMINNHSTAPQFVARSSAAVVYVKAPIASGTAYSAIVIATTVTGGVTATVLASGLADGSAGTTLGVASANGLLFQFPPVLGVFTKAATVWQDSSADAAGTVGYARLTLDGLDDFTLSTSYRRIQFTVGTSGADITSQILTTTLAAPVILNTFALTATAAMPTA
jgi:hypothetical protein